MKNNIPATKVFWYRHGTGFQAYRHEILYRQADQQPPPPHHENVIQCKYDTGRRCNIVLASLRNMICTGDLYTPQKVSRGPVQYIYI